MVTQNQFSSFSAWIKALNGKGFFKGKKSALATIFLNPSCNGTSVGQIIKGEDHIPYFKSAEIITLLSIKNTLTAMICNDVEFTNVTLTESDKILHLVFSAEKELHIKQASHGCQKSIKCSIFVNGCEVNDNILKKNGISDKVLAIDDVLLIMKFCKKSCVCIGQRTKGN